jgi:hypothetical protein
MRILHALPIAAVLAASLASHDAAAQYRDAEAGGRTLRVRSQALAQGGYAVIVDLDANRLYFARGRRVLWSAPVGTGTGLRLESDRDAWDFHTPNGVFHVTHKAREPEWIAPDWYFLEHGMRVPGQNDPRRRFTRGLGAAAVYIGHGLAIHGTDKPELLGRRVSHGCIRLSNANALRLFHDVQVGTPVMIVGEAEVLGEQPDSVARFTRRTPSRSRSSGSAVYRNPMDRLSTTALLARLDRDLASANDSAWSLTAGSLLERGLKDDAPALRGLLARAGQAQEGGRRNEYAAFLADAFSRGALRTVVSLNRIDEVARERAVTDIVEATMALYHGPPDHPTAPWPTRRVPVSMLGPAGQAGWRALQEAEAAYRGKIGMAAAGTR